MAAHAWAIGQQAWLHRPYNYDPSRGTVWTKAEVTKIGQKWGEATFGGQFKSTIRFDLLTGKCERSKIGYEWTGDLYADRTEILASLAARKALSELRLILSNNYPDHIQLPAHITADKVMAAASLLGIEIKPYTPRDE